MSARPRGFQCKRCGRCCRTHVPVTEKDIWRWAIESRDDILRWVAARDLFISPVSRQGDVQCPFLVRPNHGEVYACRIHDTKPEACAAFPQSRQAGDRVHCLGLKNVN